MANKLDVELVHTRLVAAIEALLAAQSAIDNGDCTTCYDNLEEVDEKVKSVKLHIYSHTRDLFDG